jgi:1,4-alpha-glucan branching enzyme
MGWMNDSLRYLGREPVYRQHHHHEMTFAMAYAYSENFILPISHDEVVHGKGSMFERAPEDEWRKFGNLRAFYSFMWSHPGKQLLFMGTEFGQRREFSEQRSLDWEQSAEWGHRGVQRLIKDMNTIYRAHPALYKLDSDPDGFSWISADDRGGNVFSFLRYDGEGQMIACVSNFAAEPRSDYRIGLPAQGVWEEILNSDAEVYDGSGKFGNLGRVIAGAVPAHGYPASAAITVPPLGSVWLRFLAVPDEEQADEEKVEAGVRAAAKQASPTRTRKKAAAVASSADEASVAPKRSRRPRADAKPSQPAATAGTASAARPDAKSKSSVTPPGAAAGASAGQRKVR